jgi:N-methylhydantoinase A
VPLDPAWLAAGDVARVSVAFHEAHRATFGHANDAAQIWLKELRAHVVGAMPKPRLAPLQATTGHTFSATRQLRLFGQIMEATVVDRSALEGAVVGPAIINQMDTTTLVPPGWRATRVGAGALVLERIGPQGNAP